MGSRVTQQGRGTAVAVTQRGSPGVRPGATNDRTAGIVWDYRLAIGGEKDRWEWEVPVPKGLCFQRKYALFLKILNPFPQISIFSQGTRELRVTRIPQRVSRTACGKFLRPSFFFFFFFFPFPNFPLLKIFQAFSAEDAFALLT